jgi:HK97 family phage prohead protease
MNKKEVRFLEIAELRAVQDEQGAWIEGYPVVFNQETIIGGRCREMILPEAITEALLRDVALMIGHDFGMIPLAHSRRNNGNATMTLTIDEHGVKMRALLDIENNPRAKEAYSAIVRGDISGMSFAFVVEGERWEDLDTEMPLRVITKLSAIFEVSLVAFPAYTGTSVQAASEGDALESVMASLESARQQLAEDCAREAEEERRRAVLEWLENYRKEEKSDEV